MKNLVFLVFVALFISCEKENGSSQYETAHDVVTRDYDPCEIDFTGISGHVYDDFLFYNPSAIIGYFATFNQSGWNGLFEDALFPCDIAMPEGNCCSDIVVKSSIYVPVPFSTTCNYELDEDELELLAIAIMQKANDNRPICEGVTLNPVAINVIPQRPLCCVPWVTPNPCPQLPDPCDCYDDFPNDPYFGCCESYDIYIEVKYARTTECGIGVG